MIVVLDTNVWVSALHFTSGKSVPEEALRRATSLDLLGTSEELRFEVFRVLTVKFRWTSESVNRRLDVLLLRARIVVLTHTTHVCRDPKDDMLLECAALAGADLLITGDNDLLSLESYGRTRIVTPKEYLLLPRQAGIIESC